MHFIFSSGPLLDLTGDATILFWVFGACAVTGGIVELVTALILRHHRKIKQINDNIKCIEITPDDLIVKSDDSFNNNETS